MHRRRHLQEQHIGPFWGTVASGGLPPIIDSIEPPAYNTVCVRAEYDGLAPGVALFGSWHSRDWEVNLTVQEAHAVAAAILGACDRLNE